MNVNRKNANMSNALKLKPRKQSSGAGKVVLPRTPSEFKPLQMMRAVFQRPAYDAPGCVIRGEPEGVQLA